MTVIRVLPKNEELWVTKEDIERWRKKFLDNQMTAQQAADTGEVDFVTFDPQPTEDDCYLTVFKVGDINYRPTPQDLENWRDVLEEASKGKDSFTIFTHPGVEVEVIRIGNVVAVETNNGPPVI